MPSSVSRRQTSGLVETPLQYDETPILSGNEAYLDWIERDVVARAATAILINLRYTLNRAKNTDRFRYERIKRSRRNGTGAMGALCSSEVGTAVPSFKLYVESARNLKRRVWVGHSDFRRMQPMLEGPIARSRVFGADFGQRRRAESGMEEFSSSTIFLPSIRC